MRYCWDVKAEELDLALAEASIASSIYLGKKRWKKITWQTASTYNNADEKKRSLWGSRVNATPPSTQEAGGRCSFEERSKQDPVSWRCYRFLSEERRKFERERERKVQRNNRVEMKEAAAVVWFVSLKLFFKKTQERKSLSPHSPQRYRDLLPSQGNRC